MPNSVDLSDEQQQLIDAWKESLVLNLDNLFNILQCKDQVMPYVEYAISRLSVDQIASISQRRLEQAFRHVDCTITEDNGEILKRNLSASIQNYEQKRRKLSFTEHILPNINSSKDSELSLQMDKLVHQRTLENTSLNEREFFDTSSDIITADQCYRLNPAQVNRSIQMKQDYAENLDGPLARTTLHLLKIIQEKQSQKPWYLKDHSDGASSEQGRKSAKNSYLTSDLLQKRPDTYTIQKDSHALKWVNPGLEERLANLEAFLVTPQQISGQETISASSNIAF